MQETHKLSDNLAALKEKIETGLEGLSNSKELYEFRSSYLEGKKSKISELMKEMRNLAPEERAGYGKSVNELKEWAIDRFSKMEEKMKQLELQRRYESEKIDLTLPADETGVGNLHPITLVRNQLIDIFAGMGFEVYEGAEIENDYYNFTALNTPKDHPARDMQDTFYLSPEFLLRTQTSAGQIHVMENKKPPIKILSPGRVFRSDDDATHSPMFHQMEGLVVFKDFLIYYASTKNFDPASSLTQITALAAALKAAAVNLYRRLCKWEVGRTKTGYSSLSVNFLYKQINEK